MQVQIDQSGQRYIEWEQAPGAFKRAWIQRKADPEKDWADAKGARYLNVVRCNSPGHPGGNPTDFPVFNDLTDEEILIAFVATVCGITSCPLP
jgi:hypothetical protein